MSQPYLLREADASSTCLIATSMRATPARQPTSARRTPSSEHAPKQLTPGGDFDGLENLHLAGLRDRPDNIPSPATGTATISWPRTFCTLPTPRKHRSWRAIPRTTFPAQAVTIPTGNTEEQGRLDYHDRQADLQQGVLCVESRSGRQYGGGRLPAAGREELSAGVAGGLNQFVNDRRPQWPRTIRTGRRTPRRPRSVRVRHIGMVPKLPPMMHT
jgi:hypothetical protein